MTATSQPQDQQDETRDTPQRAKVFILMFDGSEQPVVGTAQVDGAWLHVWPDSPDWPCSTYPARVINAVEWEGDR